MAYQIPHRIDVFHQTVIHHSFAQAAKSLNISTSMVSQHIAKLESELGTKLFNRTTRIISLTPAGEKLSKAAANIYDVLDNVLSDIHQIQNEPSGKITINSQSDFGVTRLIPLTNTFLQRYPRVSVDINLDDKVQDLTRQKIDVSFRLGKLQDSNYHAIKLGEFDTILCASAQYVAKHGYPKQVQDLKNHPFISLSILPNADRWVFTSSDNSTESVTLNSTVSTNSSRGLQAFVAEDMGYAIIPDFIIDDKLKNGQFVRILPKYCIPTFGIYAVYHERVRLPFAVRSFINHVKQGMKKT